jgi:hypothetical protein
MCAAALPRRRRHARPPRRIIGVALATLAILGAGPSPAPAQVFQLQGGGSSLFEGYGGVVNVWGNGYEASLGVGYLDGLTLGWSARRLLGGRDTLRVGNDALPLVLDTDVFGTGSVILAQGASVQRRRGRTTLHTFAGFSANAIAAPYFASNRPSRAMAYARAQHDVHRTLSLVGHAVATTRQSLLGSVRWTPAQNLTASATAGLGSNAPYAAAALDARTTRFDVRAALVAPGRGFRRAQAPMPLQSELERENLLVTWRPLPSLSLSAGRQHFRQDSAFRGIAQRASLNQISAAGSFLGVHLSSGVFASEAAGARNVSSSLSARRSAGPWLEGELYLLRVWEPEPSRITTPVLLLRERITPRLSLLQVVTRDRGRTSVNFGGSFTSGMHAISLDYQVAHSPYLTANPFVQTMGVNARVQLGGYALTVGSFVTPDGRVHYSAQGSTFLYRGMGPRTTSSLAGGGGGRVANFIITGRVVDEAGVGVEGAAVEIGREVVYTDSRGHFFLRRSARDTLTVKVLLDDFLAPGAYEVVRAPDTATAMRDSRAGAAPAVTIVLRRVTHRPAPAPGA